MSDFTVKSSIHDYSVSFVDDFAPVLKDHLREGDYIIVDGNVRELYKEKLDGILAETKHIVIEANESNKSYQALIPVITELIENGFRKNH
ncbi:MAG: 3-dehydroquinate synthase, partial [bacterium]|nr:3-dehydroquinate synthase [bacterium]